MASGDTLPGETAVSPLGRAPGREVEVPTSIGKFAYEPSESSRECKWVKSWQPHPNEAFTVLLEYRVSAFAPNPWKVVRRTKVRDTTTDTDIHHGTKEEVLTRKVDREVIQEDIDGREHALDLAISVVETADEEFDDPPGLHGTAQDHYDRLAEIAEQELSD